MSSALTLARAEALFASDLSADTRHHPEQISAAITRAVRAHGGISGCVEEVATEFGDHPETAAPRMRWARSIVDHLYAFGRFTSSRSARKGDATR
jgi:hypothetical protein